MSFFIRKNNDDNEKLILADLCINDNHFEFASNIYIQLWKVLN